MLTYVTLKDHLFIWVGDYKAKCLIVFKRYTMHRVQHFKHITDSRFFCCCFFNITIAVVVVIIINNQIQNIILKVTIIYLIILSFPKGLCHVFLCFNS